MLGNLNFPHKTQQNNSIYRGVLTGFNEAFIIDNETKEELISKNSKCSEIIKPVLRGKDIARYWTNWEKTKLWLIATFPSLRLNIDDYSPIKNHLLSFGKNRLEQTGQIFRDGTKSRKKTTHEWYELQDTCAYHEEFSKEKLIWIELVRSWYAFPIWTKTVDCNIVRLHAL